MKKELPLDHKDVRAIALCQKGIIWCILINLCIIAVMASTSAKVLPDGIALVSVALYVLNSVVAIFFVVGLASRLHGRLLGVALALTVLVPCIGLLVLLSLSSRATRTLTQNGVRVGLLGARLADLKSEGAM